MNVYCPHCENACSDMAPACPKCGHPMQGGAPAVAAAVPSTIPCPACNRQIIPQWTYQGRDFMASIQGLGVESHKTSRLCPLCGIDIDRYVKEREDERWREAERVRDASMSPDEKFKAVAMDKAVLLVIAGACVAVILLFMGILGK